LVCGSASCPNNVESNLSNYFFDFGDKFLVPNLLFIVEMKEKTNLGWQSAGIIGRTPFAQMALVKVCKSLYSSYGSLLMNVSKQAKQRKKKQEKEEKNEEEVQ
jgi:hypothetical protein